MLMRAKSRLRAYWAMTKSLQTGLLLVTGLAGYMSARCPVRDGATLLGVAGSLFLAISGSTVLNMVYDRDIDSKMQRSCRRPLPAGAVSVAEALALGIVLALLGVGWAFTMSTAYGLVVLAGLLFDVVIYTVWLKRRTSWSIIWGGVAGGMPILAGRVLGVGTVDGVGLLLALAVLLWIPTHIMTFSIRYQEDYARAAIPTFPSTYGVPITRLAIALSSVGASVAVTVAALAIGMTTGYLVVLGVLAFGLLALALASLVRPSERLNFGLFKYASLYMLSSMVLVAASAA